MTDLITRQKLLRILKMDNAPKERQDKALSNLDSIAFNKFMVILPDLLSDSDIDHIDSMIKKGENDDTIINWIAKQVPDSRQLFYAILLDTAEELANI